MTDWHEVLLYLIVLVVFILAAAVVTVVFASTTHTECPTCAALQNPDTNCMKFSPDAVDNAKAAGCVWNGSRWRYNTTGERP